ncbi:hypothetical protein SLS54_002429 [Diplodia seriata]
MPNQYISQTGTPKVDLAFYKYDVPWTDATGYKSSNLETIGFTYDYLGPENLENVRMNGTVLGPHGPAYRALVFSNSTQISDKAAGKVKQFADAGLPVFFVGNSSFSGISSADTAATGTMEAIIASGLENVFPVASANELPAALAKAAVSPRAKLSNVTASWYTFWRERDDWTHVFLYNDGASTQTLYVDFEVHDRTPYVFDAWTGHVVPIPQYTTTATHATVPLTLAANQTTIIAFAKPGAGPSAPHTHAVATSGSVAGLLYTADGHLAAQLSSSPGTASVTLANGTAVRLDKTQSPPPPPPTTLTSWNVSIAAWQPAADNTTTITVHTYTAQRLQPWLALDPAAALANASGTARYTTTFTFPPATSSSSLSALLRLGPVQHAMRASLNGRALPAVDVAAAVSDVGGFVVPGVNVLVVDVATNVFNAMRGAAGGAYGGGVAAQEYGLVGPVVVEWVGVVVVG